MKKDAFQLEVTKESHPHLWEPSPPTTVRDLVDGPGKGKRKFVMQMHDMTNGKTIPVKVDLSNYSEESLDSTFVVVMVRYEGETDLEKAFLGKRVAG
jgi:hypothetical protein